VRLDKFLKEARIFKRRTVAQGVASSPQMTVNGKRAKKGLELHVGDIITIRFKTKVMTIKVNSVDRIFRKEEAENMYEIVSETTVLS